MSNTIYCFSLYCEGYGETKSQVFVSITKDEKVARDRAEAKNKRDFPPNMGWRNHMMSMLVIPKETVLLLASEYEKEEKVNASAPSSPPT